MHLVLLLFALFVPSKACLPGGFGGLGSKPSCGCSVCPCTSHAYSVDYVPKSYDTYIPPPPPPPPVLSQPAYVQTLQISHQQQQDYAQPIASQPLPSLLIPPSPAASSHMYLAQPQHYQAPAPFLTLRPEDNYSADAVAPTAAPVEKYPAEPSFQIQVASSKMARETDEYLSVLKDDKKDDFITYYNQECMGVVSGTSAGETLSSASQKCRLLGCVAVNARHLKGEKYQVDFLKSSTSRVNKSGSYCLSLSPVAPRQRRAGRGGRNSVTDMEADIDANTPASHRLIK